MECLMPDSGYMAFTAKKVPLALFTFLLLSYHVKPEAESREGENLFFSNLAERTGHEANEKPSWEINR